MGAGLEEFKTDRPLPDEAPGPMPEVQLREILRPIEPLCME